VKREISLTAWKPVQTASRDAEVAYRPSPDVNGRKETDMNAAVLHRYGGAEALQYEEFLDPTLGAGEVLVHTAATSINPIDLRIRSGAVRDLFPLEFPAILGLDLSGTVEEVGPGVEGFSSGDKVFAHAVRTYASHCVVKAGQLAKVPEELDVIEAAALPTVTTTGAQLVALALKQGDGETILVAGAVGNVGRSAVCTAKERGATVIAGVLKRQVDEALAAGADRAVALDNPRDLEQLPTVDAVADTIGGLVGDVLIGKVKPGGVFASVLGPPSTASRYSEVAVKTMQVKSDPVTLLRMAYAVVEGRLEIPLGPRFPLKDAAKAHAAAENRVAGKILLVV
jgi:NADPH:quinone reductase-like Zn-dependent oxidoreductase